MDCVKYTVTAAQLNTDAEIQVDISKVVPYKDGKRLAPNQILIKNSTSLQTGMLFIKSDDELQIKTDNPTFYDFVPVASGDAVSKVPLNNRYLIFKKLVVGATTGDIEIYAQNYGVNS